jgi:cephalosporin hydroxylase
MNIFKKGKIYPSPEINVNASEFEVNNWIISEFVLEKLIPVVGVFPFPLNELMLMSSVVCLFKPSIIFEWGTHIGKSARVFYETVEAFNIPCTIHSIDLPDDVYHNEHPHKERGKLVRGLKNVSLHQGDGLRTSLKLFGRSKANHNVLFFVDGDHSYEIVKNELETIVNNIPNAIVLLHDTFYQSQESNYNTGPFNAIKNVLKDKGNYKIISTNTGLPGMTLLYKKTD